MSSNHKTYKLVRVRLDSHEDKFCSLEIKQSSWSLAETNCSYFFIINILWFKCNHNKLCALFRIYENDSQKFEKSEKFHPCGWRAGQQRDSNSDPFSKYDFPSLCHFLRSQTSEIFRWTLRKTGALTSEQCLESMMSTLLIVKKR